MQKKNLLGFLMKRNSMEVARVGVLQRRSSSVACLVMMMVKFLLQVCSFLEYLEVWVLTDLGFSQLL